MTNAVLVEQVRPGISVVTLNRPERLNAMNYELVSGLYEVLDELEHDRSCRVIVLTGAGRGFCAGLDLSEGASPPYAAGLGRAQALCQFQGQQTRQDGRARGVNLLGQAQGLQQLARLNGAEPGLGRQADPGGNLFGRQMQRHDASVAQDAAPVGGK